MVVLVSTLTGTNEIFLVVGGRVKVGGGKGGMTLARSKGGWFNKTNINSRNYLFRC